VPTDVLLSRLLGTSHAPKSAGLQYQQAFLSSNL
jgi:hypothetical protein